MSFLYGLMYRVAAFFFNILNLLLVGNLPPFGCVCVIVEAQGRFLVIKRGRSYAFPGGYMRWREHPMQTAQREAFEETGLKLKIGEFISYHSVDSRSMLHMSTLTVAFSGKVIGGELRDSIEGHAVWIDEAEVQNKLAGYYIHLFEKYRATRTRSRPSSTSGVEEQI